jgi:DnaJ like chaperone protein
MPWQLLTRTFGLDDGGYVRTALDGLWAALFDGTTTPAHERAAFTIAFVALAAKMAKADGVVAQIEAHTFERLHSVRAGEAVNVRGVFDLAAGDTAGYDAYAGRIARALAAEPRLLRDVLDALFHIAAADGILHAREDVFLRDVARIFGITDPELRTIRAAFVHEPGASDDPYAILGVSPTTTDEALKRHYRHLVRDYHPDSLAARGVPVELHAAAERKLAAINAAYDTVLERRRAGTARRE